MMTDLRLTLQTALLKQHSPSIKELILTLRERLNLSTEADQSLRDTLKEMTPTLLVFPIILLDCLITSSLLESNWLMFTLALQAHKQSVLHLHHLLELEQLIKFQELSLQSRLMITRLNLLLQPRRHSKQHQRFLISPALELVHLTDLYQSIKTPRVFWLLIMSFNHQSLQLPSQLISIELQHLAMIE